MKKPTKKSVSIIATIAAVCGAAAGIFTYKKRRRKSEPLTIRSANEVCGGIRINDEGEASDPSEEIDTDSDGNEEKENVLL